ncbi:MAG TPA: DUF2268 domain-containing putative Zn-dependent protease, partial [Symbiobacteriaceae bacterium]|nr:DUF2268 domain-containing putative Zn-dependent protease [Symbiobacteriaceae bacterium]
MKIVSAYRGMAAYAAAVRTASPEEYPALWQDLAVAPFWADWAAGQPFEARVRADFAQPYHDTAALEARAALLAASGVEELVAAALDRISALLPKVEETAVCIYVLDPANRVVSERQHGLVGQCIGDNILLLIDPTVPDWRDWVPQVLAHEWHHTVWGYQYYFVQGHRSADLLTSMVCDGQAEAFGYLVAPGVTPLWPPVADLAEVKVWHEVQAHLRSEDRQTYIRYMFGDREAGIPWCFGYQAGYHIVMSYLKAHPERSVTDLLAMEPWAIL